MRSLNSNFGRWRCTHCWKTQVLFPPGSPFYHMRRLKYSERTRLLWHFLIDSPPHQVYKQWGGRGRSPLSCNRIGQHLLNLRDDVAGANVAKLRGVVFTGPQEADETWVRCKRKHNRGRYTEKKFAMVHNTFLDDKRNKMAIFWIFNPGEILHF